LAAPLKDADLVSVQQARDLAARAREAQRELAGFTQEQVDRIVEALAAAVGREAERLARLAHQETGFGNVADKTRKTLFASVELAESLRGLRTVGVLREDPQLGLVEMAEPMGVVAAIIPCTNPTSTAAFKAIISIKARNACVLSPHPAARESILETARVMREAAVGAGLPADALSCMDAVTLEGTQELMRCRSTSVILATGGIGLVRAAYASGKPAYGVGPGNVPVYLDRSADVPRAVRDVVAGKTFDHGTLCSSEQALVCDAPVEAQALEQLKRNGAWLLDEREAAAVAQVVVTPQRLANPDIVGRSAVFIAEKAGLRVPPETRVLVARLTGVGREHPLSIEKLCPVLAFYVVRDWREGLERCRELLRFGGTGHSAGIHAGDETLIREFARAQPAFRIVANTQTSMGATGATTHLAPSMSLGCGAWAGNITSDNITPLHLLHLKRLAFPRRVAGAAPAPAREVAATLAVAAADEPGLDFVAAAEVEKALREGRKLRLRPGAIVTPSARDAAAGSDVLVPASR